MKTLSIIVLNVLLCAAPIAMGAYVMMNTSIDQPELI